MKPSHPPDLRFPPAWNWLVDEAIPSYVKGTYSPDERWRDKPFSEKDAQFFFRGIAELSDLFTEDRPKTLPAYFRHPKFRSAYLLYFLPLQAAKFLSLYLLHEPALEAMFQHGQKTGTLRIVDLGAGPGTGSLALTLWLLDRAAREDTELPPIEFHWWDTDRSILQDGRALLERLGSHFPRLRGKVTIHLHADPWWRAASTLQEETSLILMGHVLNEKGSRPTDKGSRPTGRGSRSMDRGPDLDEDGEFPLEAGPAPTRDLALAPLETLMSRARGGGLLCVEPASRIPSQQLSALRDQLLGTTSVPEQASSIWGPCPHAGRCPLSTGRDWCHFSLPTHVPGKWFKDFSRRLSAERQWLKFSYLWLAAPGTRAPVLQQHLRLVVSEPMRRPGERLPFVLTCEPERPGRLWLRLPVDVHRGQVVNPKEPAFAASSAGVPAVGPALPQQLAQQDYQKRVAKRRAEGKTPAADSEAKPKRLGKRQRERLKRQRDKT